MMRSHTRVVRLALVALATLWGGAASARSATPVKARPCNDPRLRAVVRAAEKQVGDQLRTLGLTSPHSSVYDKHVAKARKRGVDEARLLGWLRAVAAKRLCQRKDLGFSSPRLRRQRQLLSLLEELGSARSFPLLLQLEARGDYRAGMTREKILGKLAQGKLRFRVCAAPNAAELAKADKGLADFVVIDHRRGRGYLLRSLLARERADLAYFLAATREAGLEVGTLDKTTALGRLARHRAAARGGVARRRAAAEQKVRDRLRAQMKRAALDGKLRAQLRAGLIYLETLGHPYTIDGRKERRWAWGGARYSYVMRDVAAAAEQLGQLSLAEQLYRLANPGGGLCGTSVSGRWKDQVRGVIRVAERLGRCLAVVPERLLELERGSIYGTKRLSDAGFDVERLLRGALLTRYRELPIKRLEAIARADAKLGPRLLARMRRLGKEDWARRVHALEGLADVAGKRAVPQLVALAREAAPELRLRALRALTKLAKRPQHDPCKPKQGYGSFGFGGSNVWRRSIRMAGRSCKTSLRPKAVAKLLAATLKLTRERDPKIRERAAQLLGALAQTTTTFKAALARLARDPYVNPDICRQQPVSGKKGKTRCVPIATVAEAAREAQKRVTRFEAAEKKTRKR